MYYHARIEFVLDTTLIVCNSSKEDIIKGVLIPFVNGQVIESDVTGNIHKILVNMKTATLAKIFKTTETIDEAKGGEILKSEEMKQNDCTYELIEMVRELQSNPNVTSLLQKAFAQPKNQIFVIMKLSDKYLDSAYHGVIKPLAKELGLDIVRVDEIQDSGKIGDQILENIAFSKYIIADLTGERPNCYYETGFAHALGKELVLTIRKDSAIHFDLAGYRFIQWETEAELREALKERFTSLERKPVSLMR